MLGIIRVFSSDDEAIVHEHGKRIKESFGFETVSKAITNQPKGIYDDESERVAIPKIVDVAEQMVSAYDLGAISISCAADPGIEEVRKSVNIPVLGAGNCGAHAAAMVGEKVGVMGITEEPPSTMVEALGSLYHSYLFSPNIRKTTDLFSNEAKEELLRLCLENINDGADVLLFACTGFSTIGLKDYLIKYVDVPIIDLVEAQAMAYHFIQKGR